MLWPRTSSIVGELLLGLPYLRNAAIAPSSSPIVNYCLVYRTSETKIHQLVEVRSVNYYLDYRTSETTPQYGLGEGAVNYYLDYRTSETKQ